MAVAIRGSRFVLQVPETGINRHALRNQNTATAQLGSQIHGYGYLRFIQEGGLHCFGNDYVQHALSRMSVRAGITLLVISHEVTQTQDLEYSSSRAERALVDIQQSELDLISGELSC